MHISSLLPIIVLLAGPVLATPAFAAKPVANGEILELHVGLWGLGDDAESRKPVKQFFRVRLNASHPNPRAIVEPPPSAGEG